MILTHLKDTCSLTLADNSSTTDGGGNSGTAGVMDVRDYNAGSVTLPAAWVAARLTFTGCDTPGGTFLPLYTTAGAIVAITNVSTSAAQRYTLPADVFSGARYIKLVSTNTSTAAAVSQTGGPFTLVVGLAS